MATGPQSGSLTRPRLTRETRHVVSFCFLAATNRHDARVGRAPRRRATGPATSSWRRMKRRPTLPSSTPTPHMAAFTRNCSPAPASCAGCNRRRSPRRPAITIPNWSRHPLVVTNMREIFNDHIGAHIMAYVLAFARGFHYYIPQQLKGCLAAAARGHRRHPPAGGHRADRRPGRHRRRGGAACGRIRHDGDRHRRTARNAAAACRGNAPRPRRWTNCCRARTRHPDRAAHPGDRGLYAPRPLPAHEAIGVLHQHRARHDHAPG